MTPVPAQTHPRIQISDDLITQCMHCGMCLATCPTYELTKNERSSPRGRIRLMKYLADGSIGVSPVLKDEMQFCLDCQACETACPAGVHYGKLVEATRDYITEQSAPDATGFAIKFGLNSILASKRRLLLLSKLVFVLQKVFPFAVVKALAQVSKTVSRLLAMYQLAPQFAWTSSESKLPEMNQAFGTRKETISVLTGCIMDVAFPEINMDTVELLRKCSCDVIVPKGQVCCGSLHAHSGQTAKAKELAKINIDAFMKHDYDYLVSNSAGCGAFMKEYGELFANDPAYAEKAKLFSVRVLDISEFAESRISPEMMNECRIAATYHDACHLCHTQKITKQPRKVLSQIPGIEMSELPESTWCCGSAGIYNIVRFDDSMQILERKMRNIESTGAKTVIMANPGCMLQLQYGAKRFNADINITHTVSILNRVVKNPDQQ